MLDICAEVTAQRPRAVERSVLGFRAVPKHESELRHPLERMRKCRVERGLVLIELLGMNTQGWVIPQHHIGRQHEPAPAARGLEPPDLLAGTSGIVLNDLSIEIIFTVSGEAILGTKIVTNEKHTVVRQ
eukprot:SAG31_NODE_1234_length_9204_cov_9.297748_2_plen_129_part_00